MTDYWLNWNRAMARFGVEGNVLPNTELDGMIDIARFYPIDQVWEMFGITKDNKNNLSEYIGKSIEKNPQAIQVVDDHFRWLGMPIPGGFAKYQADYITTNGYKQEIDVLKVVEQTGKTVEEIAEEKKNQELWQKQEIKEQKQEIKTKTEVKKGVPTARWLMMMERKQLTGKKPSPKWDNAKLEQEILLLKQKDDWHTKWGESTGIVEESTPDWTTE